MFVYTHIQYTQTQMYIDATHICCAWQKGDDTSGCGAFYPAVMFMIPDCPSIKETATSRSEVGENCSSLQQEVKSFCPLQEKQNKIKKIPLFNLQMSRKNITQGREPRVSGILTLPTPN